MKRITSLLLILCLCLALSACGKGDIYDNLSVNCVDTEQKNSFSSEYALFDGERDYFITVEDEALTVDIEISTLQGGLSVYIARDGCAPDYIGTELPTSGFSVILSEKGEYKVHLTLDNHTGGYAFSWA